MTWKWRVKDGNSKMEKQQLKSPTELLKNLQISKRVTLQKMPEGSLTAFRQKDGSINFYFRYSFDGKDHNEPIGLYNSRINANTLEPIEGNFSLKAAIRTCESLSIKQKSLKIDHKSLQEERVEKKVAKIIKKETEEKAKKQTLDALLELYLKTHLNEKTKKQVTYCFKNIPKYLLQEQANKIGYKVFDSVISEVSKRSTAVGDKLRAYLHAAYKQAIKPKSLMVKKADFYDFDVEFNPLTRVSSNYVYNPKNTTPFNLNDLKDHFNHLKNQDTYKSACLRLHVLFAGPRIAQLTRLKREDVFINPSDENYSYIVLYDPKGSKKIENNGRGKPYYLPMNKQIEKEVKILLNNATAGDFLFSADNGKTKIRTDTLSEWGRSLQKTNSVNIPNFQLKRVRSACTILMNNLGITRDLSNQIQSHGSLDVVDKHYLFHDKNLQLKIDALNKLFFELNPPPEHLKLVKEAS